MSELFLNSGKPLVLVVEDDPTMAEMVSYNLRRAGLETSVAAAGPEGLRMAKTAGVGLVILDIMLPGMDGIEIAGELRRVRPGLPILMLTASGEEKTKLAGFSAGADDYLTKPFSMEELLARVRALLRRHPERGPGESAPESLVFGDLRIDPGDFRAWVDGAEIRLRPKEFALLALLAGRPGRLVSRAEITEKIWGFENMADTRTVDTHIKNLRRKVEAASKFTYIETERGLGYRFRPSPKGRR